MLTMCQTLGSLSETAPALRVVVGDRRVNQEFQRDLESNKTESQAEKYGSPELELDEGEGLVWKMSCLGQQAGYANV